LSAIEAALVSAINLTRAFNLGGERIVAVRGVNLEVLPGQLMVITGRSGSGKTTMLNLLAGLDRPTSGSVLIRGQDTRKLSDSDLVQLRRQQIGFVFQSFGLLPLLSAFENVELPLRIARWKRREREQRTRDCLKLVGLDRRASHRPYELSGGERQRVAIARAIAHRPCLIFADEPTGELDTNTGAAILSLLRQIVQEEQVGVVVVTHDLSATKIATHTHRMSDGALVD
jgi:putative ABC transport system ATP-binding protein